MVESEPEGHGISCCVRSADAEWARSCAGCKMQSLAEAELDDTTLPPRTHFVR